MLFCKEKLPIISNIGLSVLALEIICEVSKGVYQKHFVYLNEWTMYVVEDLEGSNVEKYHYEVNYLPEMIVPFTFVRKD